MGYYVQGPAKGKANYIVSQYGGKKIDTVEACKLACDESNEQAAICIVDNGPFEAAAFLFSGQEFEAFNAPTDYRPRCFIAMNRAEAKRLTGYSR